ncbi:hypothetical protein [Streptomyces sp. CB03911]|uniref:hypothetical protein n=1 Tax=Streptomyces sp. CB03911 TaxID=1804758 RepID=UPI0018FECD01|nr:hypothetical protein [Streptomyces sp. CB03911]
MLLAPDDARAIATGLVEAADLVEGTTPEPADETEAEPVDELEDGDTPPDGIDTEYTAGRADVVRIAHKLLTQLPCAEPFDVRDLIRVAEFLTGDGLR